MRRAQLAAVPARVVERDLTAVRRELRLLAVAHADDPCAVRIRGAGETRCRTGLRGRAALTAGAGGGPC